jgi:hypothetical protein
MDSQVLKPQQKKPNAKGGSLGIFQVATPHPAIQPTAPPNEKMHQNNLVAFPPRFRFFFSESSLILNSFLFGSVFCKIHILPFIFMTRQTKPFVEKKIKAFARSVESLKTILHMRRR